MTVIDVNTGKFTGSGGNLEQTVTKNNLEAAEELVRQLRLRDIGGIVVIDFIDMVLESNRDLVLRRLTEALARDRTRHQVSEVTSLGLVQLTRKRLGTGLIEAFSTSCPNCGGRGVLIHTDPVDSAPSNGRKSESGGRRGKRSKKSRSEEPSEQPPVAKVPAHAPGEHPMFKAMAAGAAGTSGAGIRDDEESDESGEELTAKADKETKERAAADLEDTDQEEFEDSDEDTEDSDDDTDDEDDEDELDEDELDDEDLDDDDEDLDLDDDDLDVDSESDDEAGSSGFGVNSVSPFARPRRRRAAGRPAGPPIHMD
jgi:ribonuclease E